jgi:mannosyltransferase
MNRERRAAIGWLVLGAALVVTAAVVSDAAIERTLMGQSSGKLAWGPTLFRLLLAVHGLALMLVGIRIRKQQGSTRPDAESASAPSRGAARLTRKIAWVPWFVLGGLSFIAVGLRLWHLNSCLWFDEVLALLDYVRPPLATIVTSFESQNQHMLFSILAHFSIRWFGESAWAVRLPAVVFGVASICALFLLGRHLVGNLEALLACTLMTFSYHEIWFSQNARGYTGLLFFATLATWLWLEAISRGTWRWWIFYGVASFCGLWVHLTMAFVLLAHVAVYLVLLVSRRARVGIAGYEQGGFLWKPIVAWLLCGSLTLQVYALALPQFFSGALHEGVAERSVWTNPIWAIQEALRGLQIGWSGTAVVLCGAVLALLGWLSIWRRNWQAAVIMVLPGLLGGATMLALGHNLWPRFFFFAMGFALLILVRGAMVLPQLLFSLIRRPWASSRLGRAAGVVLASLLIVASALTVPRCYAAPKQDFTGALNFVEHARQPDETVVAVGLAAMPYRRYFAPQWLTADDVPELQILRRGQRRMWLVYTIPLELQQFHPALWNLIKTDFEVIKVFPGTLGGGQITVCRERSDLSASMRFPFLLSTTQNPNPTAAQGARARQSTKIPGRRGMTR